jgi:hypothetical protein
MCVFFRQLLFLGLALSRRRADVSESSWSIWRSNTGVRRGFGIRKDLLIPAAEPRKNTSRFKNQPKALCKNTRHVVGMFFSDVLSQTAIAGLPKPSVCAPNNAPCKAAPHFQVPRSKAAFSPLARYFNNGSFPFQHSEHKRNESKFGSLTQACSRETPLVQMSTLSSVFGSKPGRWELRAHISSADDLLWFVQLCTKKSVW